MVSMIPLPRRASPSTLWGPLRPLCGAFPPDGSRSPSPAERPLWAPNRRKTRETWGTGLRRPLPYNGRIGGEQASPLAVHARHRRPRTAFGLSLRAEALHPLQVARTSVEVRKTASGGATSKGDQSPFENSPALRGRRKDLRQEVTL